MSRRPFSIVLLLGVLLATAVAVWAVSTRSRPALAVYDSMPAPPPSADQTGPTVASPTPTPALDSGKAISDSTATPVNGSAAPRAARPASARSATDTADTVARPHRSDNYGGYSGYGSKERRGDRDARR